MPLTREMHVRVIRVYLETKSYARVCESFRGRFGDEYLMRNSTIKPPSSTLGRDRHVHPLSVLYETKFLKLLLQPFFHIIGIFSSVDL